MCSQCLGHTGFAAAHGVCAFPVYTAQALGCSARNCLSLFLSCMQFSDLSHSGSGSRLLQRHRLGWACVLCSSQFQAAMVTRCLVSIVTPGEGCDLSPPPSLLLSFLGVQPAHILRCTMCLFWGADLWL